MTTHIASLIQRAAPTPFALHTPHFLHQLRVFIRDTSPSKPAPKAYDDLRQSQHQLESLTTISTHHSLDQYRFIIYLYLSFLFLLIAIVVYIIIHPILRGDRSLGEGVGYQFVKRVLGKKVGTKTKRKGRPQALYLGSGWGDEEAQVLRPLDGVQYAEGAWEDWGTDGAVERVNDRGVKRQRCTAVEIDTPSVSGETLTPFTPARARARRYGEGDVEAVGEEEDELGVELGRYFFEGGVGVMRYQSWGRVRGWKDG